MNYYILMPGDTEADTINDVNHLGDVNGFGVFWAATGFKILHRMIQEQPQMLDDVRIFDERGKQLPIEDFLTVINSLQIRIPK
jgi:hypothetical protein